MSSQSGMVSFNEWFISAIKSSKVDSHIQEKTLLQNCISCTDQVKSFIESNAKDSKFDFEEFWLNATALLILGCPSINSIPEISTDDFIPLVKSIPLIEEKILFNVVKGLKNYKYLRGILPWLPTKVVMDLMLKFLDKSQVGGPTPLALAISFELFFSVVYSLQFGDEVDSEILQTSLGSYIEFVRPRDTNFNFKEKGKSKAYHFLYLIESLYLLMCLAFKKELEETETISHGLKFKNLRKNTSKNYCMNDNIVKKTAESLLNICDRIVSEVTTDVWISFHSINSPTFGITISSSTENRGDGVSKSVQLQIAHTAYKILKTSCMENSIEEDHLNLNSYSTIPKFLTTIASDPDHDVDTDLTNSELITQIPAPELEEERIKKLLTILVNRDDIFNSEQCLECVKLYGTVLPKTVISSLTERVIDRLQIEDEMLEGWKRVVLDLGRKLPREELLRIIKIKLDFGRSECLKTQEFLADVTQIFNQLSDESNRHCYDSYVWLCLQSGCDVVKYSVEMALSLSGLVPVIAPGLHAVHFICRTKTDAGTCLLTELLKKGIENLSPDNEKEFEALVAKLLEKNDDVTRSYEESDPSQVKELLPVDVSEILTNIVYPRLKWEEGVKSNILLPLSMLKFTIDLYPEIILDSQSYLATLIVSLALIHNNCNRLRPTNFAFHLNVRSAVERVMRIIMDLIVAKKETYEKETSLVKLLLSDHPLHSRSMVLLSPLVTPLPTNKQSIVDRILSFVIRKGDHSGHALPDMPKCNRIEWIWALCMILPDCSEEEWLVAIQHTHSYLKTTVGNTEMVNPTLKIFQEVLLLLCDSVARLGDDPCCVPTVLVSLSHCFKSFASAATNFLLEILQENENKFFILLNTFGWWCVCLSGFDCDAELPCIFLNNLCSVLNDLIRSKIVVIRQEFKLKEKINTVRPEESKVPATGGQASLTDEKLETGQANLPGEKQQTDLGGEGSKIAATDAEQNSTNGQLSLNSLDGNINKSESVIDRQQNITNGQLSLNGLDGNIYNFETNGSNHTSDEVNGSEESYFNDTVSKRWIKRNIKQTVIPKSKYEQHLKALVRIFVNSVPTNTVACTVAGKLKLLYEV